MLTFHPSQPLAHLQASAHPQTMVMFPATWGVSRVSFQPVGGRGGEEEEDGGSRWCWQKGDRQLWGRHCGVPRGNSALHDPTPALSVLSRADFGGSATQPTSPPRQMPCCKDIKCQTRTKKSLHSSFRGMVHWIIGQFKHATDGEVYGYPPLLFIPPASSFVKKSYKVVGQVATMTNNLAILQDYQGGLMHDFEGKVTMETHTELRKATDFSVAMITCARRIMI